MHLHRQYTHPKLCVNQPCTTKPRSPQTRVPYIRSILSQPKALLQCREVQSVQSLPEMLHTEQSRPFNLLRCNAASYVVGKSSSYMFSAICHTCINMKDSSKDLSVDTTLSIFETNLPPISQNAPEVAGTIQLRSLPLGRRKWHKNNNNTVIYPRMLNMQRECKAVRRCPTGYTSYLKGWIAQCIESPRSSPAGCCPRRQRRPPSRQTGSRQSQTPLMCDRRG